MGHSLDDVAALELQDVAKSYGAARAVDGISLRVEPREFVTLLGPSGCGKTSLLNMIAGFFPPSAGRILLHGRDVTGTAAYLRDVGVVFQNYALFPHMTVAGNIAFGLEERRRPQREITGRVAAALDMVGLSGFGQRRPAELSGGQQQRVALARALVFEPKLLLLDEPLSALDKNLRTQMQIEIKRIQRQTGVAAIFVTHDQNEALSLSDRIAVLKAGRIEQIGTAREIYCSPCSSYVASFVGDINRFPGFVASGATQTAIAVDIGGGVRLRAGRGGFVAGAAVDVFVRPEEIAIMDAAPDGPGRPDGLDPDGRGPNGLGADNVLAGAVAAHSYQGSFTHVVVDVPGLPPVMVSVPGGEVVAAHPPGTPVRLRLDLAQASILPG